jgi:chaperone BCS1
MGIMLYGEPGTGKTSIIKALASHYKKKICFFPVANLTELPEALASVPQNSFIVIEDIDTNSLVNKRSEEPGTAVNFQGVNLSSILNALDGIVTVGERVLIMTTNHAEKLDSALVRPGRIDLKVNVSYISKETFIRFIKVFYEDKINDRLLAMLNKVRSVHNTTIAALQSDFMKGLSAEMLIEKYCEIGEKKITLSAALPYREPERLAA